MVPASTPELTQSLDGKLPFNNPAIMVNGHILTSKGLL